VCAINTFTCRSGKKQRKGTARGRQVAGLSPCWYTHGVPQLRSYTACKGSVTEQTEVLPTPWAFLGLPGAPLELPGTPWGSLGQALGVTVSVVSLGTL